MVNELNAQDLIEACLHAMRLRHLEQSQQLLQSLEALAGQQPSLKPWCGYLQAYRAFEIQRDWAEAERILAELLQAELEPRLGGRVLYALGRSFDAQGRWAEAIAAFAQSLAISTELDQPPEKARAWKHMAISYYDGFTQGDFSPTVLAQAITYCQSALAELEPVGDPPPDIAWLKGTIWNTLGLIYVSLGQWDEAITCYQQDLAICHSLDDRHGLGLTYGNLGEVYQKRGSWPEALAAYQQALSLIREFDNRYDEIEALANLAFLHQDMDQFNSALDYYSQAIQAIEQLRAGISSEVAQAGFFATVVDIYANTVLLCLTMGHEAQAFNIVEQARSRAFLDTLATRSPHLSAEIETATLSLAQVQATLPADVLLLEYFTTGLVEAYEGQASTSQEAQRHRFPPARTLLFAVTQAELQVHDVGISPNDLRPSQLNNVVERHFLQPQIRRTLYERLISPVEQLLQGKRRLYLAPHGPLHYIPFQALIAPDGDTLLRETGPQLVYTPSATLLWRYGPGQSRQRPLSCLTLGYNSEGATQLYFAEAEARGVARLMGGQAMVGSFSKKADLYQQAPHYRLLHFACHGEFDPEAPLASLLHLAPAETLTAVDIFNHLRLQCDLVTLSACESGLSRVRRGDELVGLMRAFMYAGASALVSTLWRVDDYSTRILMEKFYRELQIGTDFAEALKQAQLYLKNLTSQEALGILGHFGENDSVTPGHPPNESQTDPPIAGEAQSYLRGAMLGGKRGQEISVDEGRERIFADPAYWAAFILVGDSGP